MIQETNVGLVAVLGLTSVEIIKLWQSIAPSLEDVRAAPDNSEAMINRLQDADILGASTAVLIGGTTSLLLKSWLPIIMALGSVSLFSYWHHMVLNADHTVMEG